MIVHFPFFVIAASSPPPPLTASVLSFKPSSPRPLPSPPVLLFPNTYTVAFGAVYASPLRLTPTLGPEDVLVR